MKSTHTFSIHTLGCKLNFSESSGIAREMEEAGYARVETGHLSDILILNTCSVTDNADKKCRAIIRKAKSENPNVYIAVIGCYAQLKPMEISEIEGVNLVLGASEKFNIIQHIEESIGHTENEIHGSHIKEVKEFVPSYSIGDRTRSFLKVQDGCDYFCSFCTIPLARGRSRSPKIEIVLDQAREIASKGIKEIVLTGVNIGDFGNRNEGNFLELINKLDEIEGIERFRISSIEPNLLEDRIIDFVSTSKRFVPHFHIPLQSGSDALLKSMRRRYDTSLYRNRIERIKKVMPDACIGVDVITGYPGETDERFKETLDFLMSLDVSYLHVFTYSERNNTTAIRKSEVVPVDVRRQRSRHLQEVSRKMKRKFYDHFVGHEMPVLLEKSTEGKIQGFTPNYLRVEIDGDSKMENTIQNIELQKLNADDMMQGDVIQSLVDELIKL